MPRNWLCVEVREWGFVLGELNGHTRVVCVCSHPPWTNLTRHHERDCSVHKLQALVYDILPQSNHCHNWLHHRPPKTVSKRTVFHWCSDGSKFVTETEIILGVSLITAHTAFASTNKTKIVWIETELFFLPAVDTPRVNVRTSVDAMLLPQSY